MARGRRKKIERKYRTKEEITKPSGCIASYNSGAAAPAPKPSRTNTSRGPRLTATRSTPTATGHCPAATPRALTGHAGKIRLPQFRGRSRWRKHHLCHGTSAKTTAISEASGVGVLCGYRSPSKCHLLCFGQRTAPRGAGTPEMEPGKHASQAGPVLHLCGPSTTAGPRGQQASVSGSGNPQVDSNLVKSPRRGLSPRLSRPAPHPP